MTVSLSTATPWPTPYLDGALRTMTTARIVPMLVDLLLNALYILFFLIVLLKVLVIVLRFLITVRTLLRLSTDDT